MSLFGYFAHVVVYRIIAMVLVSPLVLLLVGVAVGVFKLVEGTGSRTALYIAVIAGIVVLLPVFAVVVFGVLRFGQIAARRRVFENAGFYEALQGAWPEAKAELAAAPIVGGLISRLLIRPGDPGTKL